MHNPRPIRWVAVCCLLFGASLLIAGALAATSLLFAASAQASAGEAYAPIVVRFNGATFSVATLTATTADSIQVWNDAAKSYTLRAELQATPVAAAARLYLPVLMNPTGGHVAQAEAGQAQATRIEVKLAAGESVTLNLQPAGVWRFTVLDANGNPIDGATADVTVTGTNSGGATPTPTSPVPTSVAPTPSVTTIPATPPPATVTPVPTAVPGGQGKMEWTYHKSADGIHPDGNEQQMVWLMNRARANPAGEGAWLAQSTLPQIAGPRGYFNVNLALLQAEFATYAAKPPAAFDVRLYNAAHAHSLDLIARDAQDHTGQFDRIPAAGFEYTAARGSVAAYADSGLGAHGGFNIDYGNAANGMQDGRGHRKAVMALDAEYTNVGIAMVAENDSTTQVGPLVTTANYCEANTAVANEYNRFFVGTVWSDRNGNSLYDPGEGLGGVSVVPDSGDYYAVTGAAGGFAIPVLNPGNYTLHVDVAGGIDRAVTVAGVSVLVDVMVPAQAAAGADAEAAEAVQPAPPNAGATPRLPAPPIRAGESGEQ